MGPIKLMIIKIVSPSRNIMKYSMEGFIHHFKIIYRGFYVKTGETYSL